MANETLRLWATELNAESVDWKGFRAVPWNLPQKRPGLYLFINILDGSPYVGISQEVRRRAYKHSRGESPARFRNAIEIYGNHSFIIIPIAYWINGTDGLHDLEAELIQQYNSIGGGYNIRSHGGPGGPGGAVFSAIIKAALSRPEYKAAASERQRQLNTPEYRAKQAARQTEIMSDPTMRAIVGAAAKVHWARPETRQRHIDGSIRMWAERDPELRSQMAHDQSQRMADPKEREMRRDQMRLEWANPEQRARRTEAVTKAWEDPQLRADQSARQTRIWADPAMRAAHGLKIKAGQEAARQARSQDSQPDLPLYLAPDSEA